MQILVTGGAGVIGGHLVESLLTAGHDGRALDNLDPFYVTDITRHTIETARAATADGESEYEFVDGVDAFIKYSCANREWYEPLV